MIEDLLGEVFRESSSGADIFESATTIGDISGICAFLALVGGFLLFFVFLSRKNEGKFTGFLGVLYDYLSFKKMLVESMLKLSYLVLTCFITLFSFGQFLFVEGGSIGSKFILLLSILLIGNIITRVLYEFSLLIIMIYRNITEINKKLNNNTVKTPLQPTGPKTSSTLSQGNVFCHGCGNKYDASKTSCPRCGKAKE